MSELCSIAERDGHANASTAASLESALGLMSSARLSSQQQLLYASNRHAVLLIFQAMDAAGKDGAIRHVMSGVNPQGCQVFSFKHPSAAELEHDFLWRTSRDLPELGRIGIFNQSYYEEVLIVRVHPEILHSQAIPDTPHHDKEVWHGRYIDSMNAERVLVASEGIGDARWFIRVASKYASERIVFDRPIGQNQAVQFPIARAHAEIEAAALMVHKAAALFQAGRSCGAEANMGKLLASEAAWHAAEAALQTHGGFGYAKEYDVERKWRERGSPRSRRFRPI
jgi:hypothetical protein